MKFKSGDDVIVTFDGHESPGEVISHSGVYVMCRIAIDPEVDYGSLTSRLPIYSYTCVKESDVRYP